MQSKMFLLLLLVIPCAISSEVKKCNTFERLYKASHLCDYNPDENLDTVQFIRKYGYNSEAHTVLTDDGYLLTLHRIPGPKSGQRGGQPVLLQHGLLASSFDWVVNGNVSLAFMLADLGFDVWMGNSRGNTYSRVHINISDSDPKFWNFSFHEMAVHDLPAVISYVTTMTKRPNDLIYVGHSMGTTMFFAMSSLLPEVAKNIKLMIALAPVAYMTHIKSPIRYLTPFISDVEWLRKWLGLNEFLPNNQILKFLSRECEQFDFEKEICENIVFLLCGFDRKEFNQPLLGVILHHTPAGASTKTLLHYAHEIKNQGSFQQYDYGETENMIHYNSLEPPSYNISAIKNKIYLMYADNDWLASPIDVNRLGSNLPNLVGSYKIKLESFNHVDFIFGKHTDKLVIKPLLKVIYNQTIT